MTMVVRDLVVNCGKRQLALTQTNFNRAAPNWYEDYIP